MYPANAGRLDKPPPLPLSAFHLGHPLIGLGADFFPNMAPLLSGIKYFGTGDLAN